MRVTYELVGFCLCVNVCVRTRFQHASAFSCQGSHARDVRNKQNEGMSGEKKEVSGTCKRNVGIVKWMQFKTPRPSAGIDWQHMRTADALEKQVTYGE